MQSLTVSLVQTSLHWENQQENLKHFSNLLNKITDSTDVIVLPEMFSTGFTMQPEKLAEPVNGLALQWMQQKAKEKNAAITGSVVAKEDNGYYNRLYWVEPNGKVSHYNKRHLFRFAGEHNHYVGGEKKLIVEYKGWKICPLICYDLRFPVWSRNHWKKSGTETSASYDLLIYVANWPERRNHPWKTLLLARAIENQAYVIGVNRTGDDGNAIAHSGDSALIDFKGELISTIKPFEESIATHTISLEALADFRKAFPAGMDADAFTLL